MTPEELEAFCEELREADRRLLVAKHAKLFGTAQHSTSESITDADVHRVVWIVNAIAHDSNVAHLYREQALDIEGDIIRSLPSYQKLLKHVQKGSQKDAVVEQQYLFELKLLWRYLFRRYAFGPAWKVGKALRIGGEDWRWRLWRTKDWVLLRLGAGITVGFVALSGSDALVEPLRKAAETGYFSWILGACLLLVYSQACAQVQRQVGRRSPSVVLSRGLGITAVGSVYGAIGAGIVRYVGLDLGFCVPWRFALLAAGVAVAVGFLVQLFWQEQSLADPL